MVVLLALVLLAANIASRPKSWYWLTGQESEPAPPAGTRDKARGKIASAADDNDSLPPGAFRLAPAEAPVKQPDDGRTVPHGKAASKNMTRIPASILATIKDETVGIRNSERPAYYLMLARSRDTPQTVLEREGRTDVSFAQLNHDPHDYRGELITLDGELRRFLPLAAGENDDRLDTLYEGWLFTESGGPKNPYRVICTSKPAGMPTGEQVREHVRFTGYFFKRYGYETTHGLHSAPLLLTSQFQWSPAPNTPKSAPAHAPYVLALIAVLGAGFAAGVWWFTEREKKIHAAGMRHILEPQPQDIAALRQIEALDPNTFLRDLAEQASGDDAPENFPPHEPGL